MALLQKIKLLVMAAVVAAGIGQADAQSVPNPESPINQGVVWTPAQWRNAFTSKQDYGAPVLLKSYTTSQLPSVTSANVGLTAWVSDCRNGVEQPGFGTGCEASVSNAGAWVTHPSPTNTPIIVATQNLIPGQAAQVQGNGNKIQLSTGTTTLGHCVQYDASGNTIDAGASCGAGGGSSGTVSPSAGTQLAWYPIGGSSVSGLPTIANGVVSTNSSGAPQISTTLPTNLNIRSTILGVKSYTVATLPIVSSGDAGLLAWASDCRNGIEASGAGTGCLYIVNSAGTWTPMASLPTGVTTIGGQTFAVGGTIAVKGNSAFVQLASGTEVSGHCAQFDSSSNIVDAGAACGGGGGGGSGVVTSSLTNQLGWFAADGTTISGLSTGNSGVLVTSSSGVPSISSTLPSGIILQSPVFNGFATMGSGSGNVSMTQGATGIWAFNLSSTSSEFDFRNSAGTVLLAIGNTANRISADGPLILNPTTTISGTSPTAFAAASMSNAWSGTYTGTSPYAGVYLGMTGDNVAAGTAGGTVLGVYSSVGGNAMTGNRFGADFSVSLNTLSANSAAGTELYGSRSAAGSTVNDGGTALTVSGARGSVIGSSSTATLGAASTNYISAVGFRSRILTASGATMLDKVGAETTQANGDTATGTRDDIGYALANPVAIGSGVPGWKVGIGIGRQGGNFPLVSTGTLMQTIAPLGTGTVTFATAFDFSNANITGYIIKTPNVLLDGPGNLALAGKMQTAASTASKAGINILPGVAPTSPVNGDMWTTSSAAFIQINGVSKQIGTGSGTVTSIAGGGGIIATPSPITGTGTITCPTCALLPTGGTLTATGPMFISNTGNISLGAQPGTALIQWDAQTVVQNNTYYVTIKWPWATGTINSITYLTGGSSPSFAATVQIGGTNVTGCSAITVSGAAATSGCTAANAVTTGQPVTILISNVSGTPTSAAVQLNFSRSAS